MRTSMVLAQHVHIVPGRIDILGYGIRQVSFTDLPPVPPGRFHALVTLDPMPTEEGPRHVYWRLRSPEGVRTVLGEQDIQINPDVNYLSAVLPIGPTSEGEWWLEFADDEQIIEALPLQVHRQPNNPTPLP